MPVFDRFLMPLAFDPEGLVRDALQFASSEWQPHFNTGTYEGDWSGIPLRSTGGSIALYPDPHAPAGFSDTEYLPRCPSVLAALAAFECPIGSVRFLRLGEGARILEHRDYGLEFETGEARMHVPVISPAGVEFVLAGVEIPMQPGQCWYVDVNRPHRVENRGPGARIHLVIDCMVNDWLREQIG